LTKNIRSIEEVTSFPPYSEKAQSPRHGPKRIIAVPVDPTGLSRWLAELRRNGNSLRGFHPVRGALVRQDGIVGRGGASVADAANRSHRCKQGRCPDRSNGALPQPRQTATIVHVTWMHPPTVWTRIMRAA
jgi:hypothetical protein